MRCNHLAAAANRHDPEFDACGLGPPGNADVLGAADLRHAPVQRVVLRVLDELFIGFDLAVRPDHDHGRILHRAGERSEEHTSELQSLMRISYAVFCLKKNTPNYTRPHNHSTDTTHQTED